MTEIEIDMMDTIKTMIETTATEIATKTKIVTRIIKHPLHLSVLPLIETSQKTAAQL